MWMKRAAKIVLSAHVVLQALLWSSSRLVRLSLQTSAICFASAVCCCIRAPCSDSAFTASDFLTTDAGDDIDSHQNGDTQDSSVCRRMGTKQLYGAVSPVILLEEQCGDVDAYLCSCFRGT